MEGAIAADLGDGRAQAVVLKQVEKMKMGMHHTQLHSEILDSPGPMFELSDQCQAMRRPENVAKRGLNFEKDSPPLLPFQDISEGRDEECNVWRRKNLQKKKRAISIDDPHIMENQEKLKDGDYGELRKSGSDTIDMTNGDKKQQSKQGLMSGVQFLEEGVAQVQSLGTKPLLI
ncbi:unnamed protein product [Sphagnum jensenii]|uniref:Uncharacterized protein n=1 Tax=Sphagnum jensenii TaxID=128206 RepID=A0ABP1BGB6_9BRYO